ncbi:MAG: AMP-binding protein [Candidatus Hydrogenedens sp.]|nr:AMP-binding protein [Candidatus Hydrogenedens sp.]
MGLNLGDCLRLQAASRPDAVCVRFGAVRMTYGEVDAAARRVARMLADGGMQPRTRVALMLPNVPQFVVAYYGALYAGATVVTLNPLLRPRELRHVIKDAQVEVLFAFADFAGTAAGMLEDCPPLKRLLVVEAAMTPETPAYGESFMAAMLQAQPDFEPLQMRPEDLAGILYTAAQDGTPRGAMLSHFNLFQNALTISTFSLRYFPEDVFLTVLPLFHGFGLTTMLNGPLLQGSSIVLLPRFDATSLLDTMERERVTLTAMVPTMFTFLLQTPADKTYDLSALRCAVAGGSKMDLDVAAAFTERFKVPVFEGYGLTETSPVVSFNYPEDESRPGSVGRPIWGCEYLVVDEDDNPLPPGQEGEVCLRGHNVFQGYLNDPESSAKVLRNGWLHTGDLGYLDEDGFLYLTGLKKVMLLRAGMNVYPREVEKVLEDHPLVREAAVVGVADMLRGQDVKGFVALEPGAVLAAKELLAWCRDQLSSYKCPRRIEFVDALPHAADGGIDRAALLSQAAEAVS